MARIPAPAVLGSGRGRSRVGSGGQLVNFYAEQAAEGADTAAWFSGCPGLSQFADTGNGYVRALYTFKGQAYAVTNDGLYRISGSGTSTRVAAISVSRAASIADNGLVMVIVDGNRGWAFNGTTVAAIGEDGFYGADNVIFFNQYFIFNRSGTGQFFWSEILAEFDGSSLDPLDFATAEYGPDKLVGIDTLQQQLWLFGEKSVEIWYASGDENTFLRIPGGVIDRGCAGSYAHTKTGDNVFWLSGEGIVYTNAGYQAQRVSTHSVEFDLKGRDLSSAQMWSYEDEGHTFVMLTLGEPSRTTGDQPEVQDAKRTWCFDASTGVWHIRSHIDYGRHLANAYCRAYDRHLVGSFVDGKVYEMALEKYTDAGRPLVSEVWYSPLTNNRSRMFHSSFEVDGDWGWGDLATVTDEVALDAVDETVFTIVPIPSSGNVPAFAGTAETLGALTGTPFYRVSSYAVISGQNALCLQGTSGSPASVGFYTDVESYGIEPLYTLLFRRGFLATGVAGQTSVRLQIYQANKGVGELGAEDKALPPDATDIEEIYDQQGIIGTSFTPATFEITKPYVSAVLSGWSTTGAAGNAPDFTSFSGRLERDAVNIAGSVSFQTPLAQVSWSDDGGMTWSNQRIMGVGEVGERGHRFIARRLGQSRDRIYRFAMDGAHPHRISAVGFIEGAGE